MSRYSLSEEYSQIYSKKFDTNLYDNLRFVDQMMDEDIEYVMESLYWEFRDYGSSSDESFEILESTLTEDSLNESLEYIYEMNPYASAGSKAAQEYNKYVNANRAAAKKEAAKKAKTAEQKAKFEARKARITGGLRRVKRGIESGAQNLAGKVQSGLSSARKGAMAQLTKLVRGARSIGSAAKSATKSAVSSAVSGAQKVGSATKAGVQAFKKELKTPTSREDNRRMGRFKQPEQVPDISRRMAAMSKLSKAAAGTSGGPTRYSTSSGLATRAQLAAQRAQKAAAGTQSKGTRFAGPGGVVSSKKAQSGRREAAARFAKKAGLSDDFAYLLGIIAEDLVTEGYADTIEDALVIFENLSENIIETTINEYADYYLEE